MPTELWLRVQKNIALMWRLRDFADFVAVGPSLLPTSSKRRIWWVEFHAYSVVASRGVGVATERIYRTILDRVFNPKDHLSIALLGLPFRVEIKAIKAGSEIRFTTVPKREKDSLCIIEWVLQWQVRVFLDFVAHWFLLLNFAFLQLTFHKSSRWFSSFAKRLWKYDIKMTHKTQ